MRLAKNIAGFSLLELIVVMSIMAIVSSVIYTKSTNQSVQFYNSDYAKRILNRETIRLDTLITQLQLLAMMHHKTIGLKFKNDEYKSSTVENGKTRKHLRLVIEIVDDKLQPVTIAGLPATEIKTFSEAHVGGTNVVFLTNTSDRQYQYLFFNQYGVPVHQTGQAYAIDYIINLYHSYHVPQMRRLDNDDQAKPGIIVKANTGYTKLKISDK